MLLVVLLGCCQTGEETAQILLEQKALEARYEELVEQCVQLKAMANKTKYRETQDELKRISYQLRQATELLCRNLMENPNVADNLVKIQTERRSLVALLRETGEELTRQQFRTLVTTVRDERNKEDNLRRTIERERQATAEVKRLSEKLAEIDREKGEAVHELNVVIAKKKTTLQKAKREAMDGNAFSKKRFAAAKYSRRRLNEEALLQKRRVLEELRQRVASEERCHARMRDFLQRKQSQLQASVVDWNDRYFADIEAKKRDLEALQIRRSQLTTNIERLTDEFETKRAVVHKENLLVKQREAAVLFGIRLGEATAKLQRLWRGHRVRRSLLAAQTRGRKRRSKAK